MTRRAVVVGAGDGAESTATMAGGAKSSSSAAKRAKVEAENRNELLRKLPEELWSKIVDENVQQNDVVALAMTCRFFREKQEDLGKKVETNLDPWRLVELRKSGKVESHSLDWFRWVCDTFEILPGFESSWRARVEGAVHEGDLMNYAAFQGSVEILRWLLEEKGWELTLHTGEWAGMGGSIELLEYLGEGGYEFGWKACEGAARGGHLKALKYLRGLEPPCPWDMLTCSSAAWGGNLDVLKWLRSQDPPCPWDEETCAGAARRGHLEVLKWARDQDPPCPWDASACSAAALGGHLDVVKFLRQDPPCPWNGRTCSSAAKGGRLEILVWLRNHGCPWSAKDCALKAEKAGHDHVVRWIKCNAM